jgi:type VI secretion system secreted protein VgrG
MPSYTQTNRILSFTSPLGVNQLLPMAFEGTEEISELFDFHVDLLATPEVVVDPSALIGKRVTLDIKVTDTGTKRYFNGIVASLDSTGGDTFFNSYRIRMVPTLWLLSLNRQTRVFQNKTALEIVELVLAPYSIVPRLEQHNSYASLEYCTQYRESDLEFVLRLMQQHGLFFYFVHSASDHVMVLTDRSSHLAECPVVSTFRYATVMEEQASFYEPLVFSFNVRSSLVTGEHRLWDYRFMQYAVSSATPRTSHAATAMGDNLHEFYDYADSASAYFKTAGADANTPQLQTALQDVNKELAEAQSVHCQGTSTASVMHAGSTFTLTGYPQPEKNSKYLLSRVEHKGVQRPGYRAEIETPEKDPYQNRFYARPFSQAYRKPKSLRKPRVNGVVTGKVVVPPGEDSYMDKYGRVCVEFWWDRNRKPSTPDNTLLRVAQQWAGNGWGTYFWPRINDEVLIDFIDGDPDAPIVVGSVYNGVNMPKYDPKSEYTRSGILTRSSRNGSAVNANELRFDDLKGSEQIFINAERDLDIHVEYNGHTLIGNDEHLQVAGNRYHRICGECNVRMEKDQILEIDGDQCFRVHGQHIESVGTDRSLNVMGSQFSTTAGVHIIQSGEEIHIIGGTRVVVEGTAGICLRSGDNIISIDATGITLQGDVRFGIANCLPGKPAPASPSFKTPIAPQWPGDDPRQ